MSFGYIVKASNTEGRILNLRGRVCWSHRLLLWAQDQLPHAGLTPPSPHTWAHEGSASPPTVSGTMPVTKCHLGPGTEHRVPHLSPEQPFQRWRGGYLCGLPSACIFRFPPKKVCEHHWREKQIGANSPGIYTDATLSFHSVTPFIKPFTIYALLLGVCIFNHFSQHLLVSQSSSWKGLCSAVKQRGGLSRALGRGYEEKQSKRGGKSNPSSPFSAALCYDNNPGCWHCRLYWAWKWQRHYHCWAVSFSTGVRQEVQDD